MSRAAGSNFIYPTEDEEPPPLVEEPEEDDAEGESEDEEPPPLMEEPEEDAAEGESEDEEPPPLMEESEEDDAEGAWSIVPVGHTHEYDDAEDRRYISNMVSRWAGSDYESSDDEYAPWRRYRERF